MLLQRLEQRLDRVVEVLAEPDQVGRAADGDLLVGAVVGDGLGEGRHDLRDDRHVVAVERLRESHATRVAASVSVLADDGGVEPGAQLTDGLVVEGLGQLDDPLLDPAGAGDQHQQQPGRRQGDHLDVTHRRPGQRRVLHDRHLLGELGEQPDAAVDHVVEVDRALQERRDGALLRAGQRLDAGQLVDEQPVALVGRDPAGAGVRLGDEALFLQHGHVVADRRRRDAQAVPLDQRLRADRLLGADVVLDDGSEDVELAVVEHAPPRSVRSGTPSTECQCY